MSNFLAIATVTATMKDLLETAAAKDVTDHEVVVLTLRPDLAKNEAQDAKATINIYLYQVTPNAAWRNADVPTRRSDGSVLQRPMVALDLHYMISFYGAENEFVTQRLLGSAVRTLQAEPQLSRERIRVVANGQPILQDSNLADQVELVKFSPLHLSLEELAKIWSVFYQIPYVLSVAYQGTVVLIESDDMPQKALPVRMRNIYVEPFNQPIIEQIIEQTGVNQLNQPDPPIVIGSTFVILRNRSRHPYAKGIPLRRLHGVDVTPQPQNVSDTQIKLPLINDATESDLQVANLRSGVQGVQVIHPRMMGTPPVAHSGVESNVAAFVLRPNIILPISPFPASGAATLTIRPVISRQQRVVLLLNEISSKPGQPLNGPPNVYSFNADPGKQNWLDMNGNVVTDPKMFSNNDTADNIVFAISGVKSGTYLIRVQIDGAESPLEVGTDPKSPTFNMYTGRPQVTIP